MTAHEVSGQETVRHLDELRRLTGLPRTMYLEQIERVHGHEYRLALAREDQARRAELERRAGKA